MTPAAHPEQSNGPIAAARQLHRQRIRRARFFPAAVIGNDLGFDILLLLVAFGPQQVTSLAYGADRPQTTTLRWVDLLHQHGLIARTRSNPDRRRTMIALTPTGEAAMTAYLEALPLL